MEDFEVKRIFESLKSAEYKYTKADAIVREIKQNTTKEERLRIVKTLKSQPFIIREADNSEYLKVVDYILNQLLKD